MFKAIIVNKAEDDTIYANLSDVKDSQLPEEGDVTIAVHYSDVNFITVVFLITKPIPCQGYL